MARYRFRLNELGFREHERMRVIQKANFGGRVVAHGTERIAIDGDTAGHILVEVRQSPRSVPGRSALRIVASEVMRHRDE
ncbi:MAG: ferrous iron transport protein A [Bifidobacterium mongoliense]|nr:ferrous iron transport protein A [Bifidobacterium mongoliense]MDN5978779.1 ferrous iron transport protein A [Bifidobacterium mongoliense]